MCTAVSYSKGDHYFGRTLDIGCSYNEEVVLTPRNFALTFRRVAPIKSHYAILGMAYVCEGYPLYYDAVNEKGLAMAGLNFVGNAAFYDEAAEKDNISQFELIPWVLSQCKTVEEAKKLLTRCNLVKIPFNSSLPIAQLHWMICDKDGAITVEFVEDGLKIYDNPAGVLTNNPPFPMQMFRLNDFMGLSPKAPKNTFSDALALKNYSYGMGVMGLPGDWSSQSRFVRAAFTVLNSRSGETEEECVGQFFHIMDTVAQARGCCEMKAGEYEITVYTSCCNLKKGIYYYTTYTNRQICAVDMRRENLDAEKLSRFALMKKEGIFLQNKGEKSEKSKK